MKDYDLILSELKEKGSLRILPEVEHDGCRIVSDGEIMWNLSSNDYLGLATREDLKNDFLKEFSSKNIPLGSTSSRLLTGNYKIYTDLERLMATTFGRDAALLFNSGYHANTGILPALSDKSTLIVADKLVHASIIDGIKLSSAELKRYRHNDLDQLDKIVSETSNRYSRIIVVTESVFSMDGDVTDLQRLVALKKKYNNVMLYVDEAHAIGVRGNRGLGVAEECGCLDEIDLLVGTYGKALASMGAYLLCNSTIRDYLVNTMRPLIFSTALPPFQIAWTHYLFERLSDFSKERALLAGFSEKIRKVLNGRGGEISKSHIIPYIVGENQACINEALQLRKKGFYCLPVRPPTVPMNTARIRFSLTAALSENSIDELTKVLQNENK